MRYQPLFLSAIVTLLPGLAFARETPAIIDRAPPASAASPVPAPSDAASPAADDRHSERRGFYFHGELGGGYRAFSERNLIVSGGGVGASLLLGGNLVPNLFLVGELAIASITNPTVRLGERSVETKDASATLAGFGPGIVYYVMPLNLSLGASALLSRASARQNGETVAESKLGFGGTARIGKEFWIGRRSSFGVGGQFMLAAMKDKGENAGTLVAKAFNVALAYTY